MGWVLGGKGTRGASEGQRENVSTWRMLQGWSALPGEGAGRGARFLGLEIARQDGLRTEACCVSSRVEADLWRGGGG